MFGSAKQERSTLLVSRTDVKKILTVQGRFETTKDPIGVLTRKGAIVDGRFGVAGGTFELGVVTERAWGVGLNDRHFFLFVIYARLAGEVGIRAWTFQLLNDLTRVLFRGLRSVWVGDGGLFQRVSFRFRSPLRRMKTPGADLVAGNNVSGGHVRNDGWGESK